MPGTRGGTPSSAQTGRYKEKRTATETKPHSHNTCQPPLMLTEPLPFNPPPSPPPLYIRSPASCPPTESPALSVVTHVHHTWIHCAHIKCEVLHDFQDNSYTLPAPQHFFFASCHCSTVQLLFIAN